MTLAVLCALALAVPAGGLAAQDRYGMLVLELPAGTRASSLGGAFVPGVPDADAVFAGPAYQAGLRGFAGGVGWWSAEALSLSLSGGGEWLGGALAAGLQTLDYEAQAHGYADLFDAEAALGAGGPLHVAERAASIAYARRVWELELSVTGKLLETRASGESARGAAFDVALGRMIGPVRLALAAQHLGPALDVGDSELTLPARVTLSGATRSVVVGPLDVVATAALAVREDGEVLPAGGLELGYWPLPGRTFFARVGARRADAALLPVTLGAGFSGDRIGVDWAFVPYDDGATDGAHRISVRLR